MIPSGASSSQSDQREAATLSRSLGLFDVTMMSAGSAMGVSIFAVLSPAAKLAGPAAILGILAAAVPMLCLAMVYAYMASVRPRTFASYEWPREFISPGFAFVVGWVNVLISASNMALQTYVLAQFVTLVLPVPAVAVRLAALALVLLLNLFGVRIAARVQTLIMMTLLVCFGIYIVAAAPSVRGAAFASLGGQPGVGVAAVLAATPLLVNLFTGIESVAEVGGEIRAPHRTLPLGILLALLLITVFYVSLAAVTIGVLGADALAGSATPFVAVAERVAGLAGRALLIAVPMLSVAKSINISFLCFSRALFALGDTRVLPTILGRVEPRRHTPVPAMLTAALVVAIGIMLPGDITVLILATTIPMLLSYGSCCLCALICSRRRDADLRSPFIRDRRVVSVIAMLGLASVVLLLAFSSGGSLAAHGVVSAWIVGGLVYWLAVGRRRAKPLPDRHNPDTATI